MTGFWQESQGHDKDLLATDEGIEAISWFNVCKDFSAGDFISVTSSPSRGTMGWVERIIDDSIHLL